MHIDMYACVYVTGRYFVFNLLLVPKLWWCLIWSSWVLFPQFPHSISFSVTSLLPPYLSLTSENTMNNNLSLSAMTHTHTHNEWSFSKKGFLSARLEKAGASTLGTSKDNILDIVCSWGCRFIFLFDITQPRQQTGLLLILPHGTCWIATKFKIKQFRRTCKFQTIRYLQFTKMKGHWNLLQ